MKIKKRMCWSTYAGAAAQNPYDSILRCGPAKVKKNGAFSPRKSLVKDINPLGRTEKWQ